MRAAGRGGKVWEGRAFIFFGGDEGAGALKTKGPNKKDLIREVKLRWKG